jgi:uncharacterized protein YacL
MAFDVRANIIMDTGWNKIRTALIASSTWLLSQVLGLGLALIVTVLLVIASTTRSDGIFHTIMVVTVLIPAVLMLYFGFRGGRKNISIWRVFFIISGLILAPTYAFVTISRLDLP